MLPDQYLHSSSLVFPLQMITIFPEEVDLEIFAGLGLGGAVNLVDSDPSQ